MAGDEAVALPHFPQLKLSDEAQYPRQAAARVPLVAVCEIGAPADDDSIAVEPLSPRNGTLCLIAHTVAARLFPEELLEAHLDLCTRVADRVAVLRVRYPRDMAVLPDVRKAITSHFAGIGR